MLFEKQERALAMKLKALFGLLVGGCIGAGILAAGYTSWQIFSRPTPERAAREYIKLLASNDPGAVTHKCILSETEADAKIVGAAESLTLGEVVAGKESGEFAVPVIIGRGGGQISAAVSVWESDALYASNLQVFARINSIVEQSAETVNLAREFLGDETPKDSPDLSPPPSRADYSSQKYCVAAIKYLY
jgi:hypothetical protein